MMAEKSPEMLEMEKQTRAAVEAYVDAWTRNDRAALINLFAEDASWIDPVGTPPWQGRAKIGEFWDMAHQPGVTLTPVVQRIVVCGNEAILQFRMLVRMAAGGGMGLDACDQMVVNKQGKIQLAKAYWDQSCIVPLE